MWAGHHQSWSQPPRQLRSYPRQLDKDLLLFDVQWGRTTMLINMAHTCRENGPESYADIAQDILQLYKSPDYRSGNN